jgi:hypothetical protein
MKYTFVDPITYLSDKLYDSENSAVLLDRHVFAEIVEPETLDWVDKILNIMKDEDYTTLCSGSMNNGCDWIISRHNQTGIFKCNMTLQAVFDDATIASSIAFTYDPEELNVNGYRGLLNVSATNNGGIIYRKQVLVFFDGFEGAMGVMKNDLNHIAFMMTLEDDDPNLISFGTVAYKNWTTLTEPTTDAFEDAASFVS